MASYLNLDDFTERTIMPPEDVEALEERRPGFVVRRLEIWSARIDAKLRKRYAVPFAGASVPDVVLGWLVAIVTLEAYEARGWDPSDAQSARIVTAHDDAIKEVDEAANSNDGLFDIPLRQDSTATGISKGGPFGYSEAGPYDWTDRQAEATGGR